MSTETNTATTELANGAAPVGHGVVASESQQPAADANPNPDVAPNEADGQAQNETPEHRKASFRFGQLTEQRNKAQQEAAYWRGVAEAARQGQNAQALPEPSMREPQAQADPEPDPDKYPGKAFDPQYLRDVARWDGRQEARRIAEESRKQAQESEAQYQQRQAFEAGRARFVEAAQRVEALEAANPNLGDIRSTLEDIARAEPPFTPGRLVDIVSNTENPEWVAAALATKQGLRAQIEALDPTGRALAIGRIDAQISANLRAAQAKPAPTNGAQASPPAPPASSPALAPALNGRNATPQFDPNKGDVADYVRWRQSQPH